MPHPPPMLYTRGDSRYKVLAIIIIVIYLMFLLAIINLFTSYIPHMEEAGEETAELIDTGEAGGGGAVHVINSDIAQEVRIACIISVISFGILDGIFAIILLFRKVKVGHDGALLPLIVIQIINRLMSGLIIVPLTITVFVSGNPRFQMNAFYLVLAISLILSLVLALIIFIKLTESKTRKIAYKIREKTPV